MNEKCFSSCSKRDKGVIYKLKDITVWKNNKKNELSTTLLFFDCKIYDFFPFVFEFNFRVQLFFSLTFSASHDNCITFSYLLHCAKYVINFWNFNKHSQMSKSVPLYHSTGRWQSNNGSNHIGLARDLNPRPLAP